MAKKAPLPRRDQIIDELNRSGRPLHARELASRLEVPDSTYLRFLELIEELSLDGTLRGMPGQRYRSSQKPAQETRQGTISVNARGFGFVSVPGQSDDIFVPAEAVAGAMHGDLVVVRVVARSKRGIEGAVDAILNRAHPRVGAVLKRRGKAVWAEPDDARLRGPVVLPSDSPGEDGEAIVVEITNFPDTPEENPEGKILEVLGTPGELSVEVRKVLLREAVSETFEDEVAQQAEAFGTSIPENSLEGREDLRDIALVTIDPSNARDHDDAIWVQENDEGFDTWIAIADVASYVTPNTPLDGCAKTRGFSLYLPDRAVPMLPRALSSNLCSLLPDVDRLCLAVWVRLDKKGKVIESRVCNGVMRSHARLTYEGVAKSMKWTESSDAIPLSDELHAVVSATDRIAGILRKKRMKRGALDLQVPEPEIILDENEKAPIDVKRRAQDPGIKRAYSAVEELMLLANEVVARFLMAKVHPAIFRVHPAPDVTKLERVVKLCDALGIEFELDDASDPKRLGLFLASIAEHPLAQIIGHFTLRSLKQAAYDVTNVGHYGLALDAYLHFTSPIRRYPDLVVHRIVKQVLREGARAKPQVDEALALVAQLCSQRERKVMEIEREISDLYRTVLMRKHIGEEVVGRVVEIASASVIVAIDSPYVDVRVPFSMLGTEEYDGSDDGLFAVAARSGDKVGLGDEIKIRIEEANINRRSTIARRVVEAKKTKTIPTKSTFPRKGKGSKDKGGKPSKKRGKMGKR